MQHIFMIVMNFQLWEQCQMLTKICNLIDHCFEVTSKPIWSVLIMFLVPYVWHMHTYKTYESNERSWEPLEMEQPKRRNMGYWQQTLLLRAVPVWTAQRCCQLISRQFDQAAVTSDADRVGKLPHECVNVHRLLCNGVDYDSTGQEESAAPFLPLMYHKAAEKCQCHLPAVKLVLF